MIENESVRNTELYNKGFNTFRRIIRSKPVIFLLIILILTQVSCKNPWMDDILDPLINATVTFHTEGGTPVDPVKVKKGTAIDEPVTAKEGFYFDGWHFSESFTNRVTFPYTVDENTALFAAWTDSEPDPVVFIPVTGITGVPAVMSVGTLTLNGNVVPADADNRTIVWSIRDAGTTGAAITGNTLNTTSAGAVIVTARITDGAAVGTAYTQHFTITVNNLVNARQPDITGQPASASYFTNGTTAALTVTASSPDGGALTYQWYSNTANANTGGTLIGGAANASYTPPVTTAGTFYYYVIVTNTIPDNGDGGQKISARNSDVAAITVTATPVITITNQPAATTTVTQGNISGSLSVTASVTPNASLSYQWYRNSTNTNTGGTIISGATGVSYTIPTTLTAGTYYYYCEVSSQGAVSVRSSAAAVNVALMQIASAAVTITAPVKDVNAVNAAVTDANITAATVWKNPAGLIHTGAFAADTIYTAEVTLTANTNYTFPSDFSVTSTPTPLIANTAPGINANSVVLTYTFPETDPVTVNEGFKLTYTHITDGSPTIADLQNPITISRGNSQTYIVTVENPGDYSISWSIAGTSVSGTEASFTLNANDPEYNAIGVNLELSLLVVIDNTPYRKIIPFMVVQ